jgi:hypothetical protein
MGGRLTPLSQILNLKGQRITENEGRALAGQELRGHAIAPNRRALRES